MINENNFFDTYRIKYLVLALVFDIISILKIGQA